MASPGSRFSRPTTGVLGVGALGVLSVGLITGGLWYDAHRSTQAVDRAREQFAAARAAPVPPQPIASTPSEAPAPTSPGTSSPVAVEQPGGGTDEVAAAPAASVVSSPPAAASAV